MTSCDASATDGIHEILAGLEALGVRVSLSDAGRIELRGTEAPAELRRALMRHGTEARAILAERRDMRDAALNTTHLRPPGAKPAPQHCADHAGFREKPCRRCGRSWGAHYPWVKASLPRPRPKQVTSTRGKGAQGNENPKPATTATP
jgi:hypothetical protein